MKLSKGDLRDRDGIGDAGGFNLNDFAGDYLANRIVAIN